MLIAAIETGADGGAFHVASISGAHASDACIEIRRLIMVL